MSDIQLSVQIKQRSTRACDACAKRKIKCNRRSPCDRCESFGLCCSILREYSKPGPKGPWAKKRRARIQVPLNKKAIEVNTIEIPTTGLGLTETDVKHQATVQTIRRCLHIYSQECYSLWPVVDRSDLSTRLENKSDVAAYALGAALGAVVLERWSRLGILSEEVASISLNSEQLAEESESARKQILYQELPTIDVLLSCFFLHIHAANNGQITKASLLLREAITLAQLLELDQAKNYIKRSDNEAQLDLRVFWMLYITERGHTTRFEFSRILSLDPNLPALQAESNPSGLLPFISMCQLFQTFCYAMDRWESDQIYNSLAAIDAHLQEARESLFDAPSSQRTDFLMTQQWMRVVVWKRAMFYVKLSADAAEGCLSLGFPEQVARNVVVYMKDFPRKIVESHGLGMQMKLTDIAISFADVLSCTRQLMQVGSAEILHCLTNFLISAPNQVNPRLRLLQEKLYRMDWKIPPERTLEGSEDADGIYSQKREHKLLTSNT